MTEQANNQARVLWGNGTSRVFRAHWALIELNLPYQHIPLRTRTTDMDRADFVALNPSRKIPALQDGDLVVTESTAIVTYLAERYSTDQCRLIPTDLADRARYFEWMSLISMELDATSLYVLRRHQDLSHLYGDAPVANKVAGDYFVRMIRAAEQRYNNQHALKESDQRELPFLLGNEFSGADIFMMSVLDWANRYNQPVPATFARYREQLSQRDGYVKAVHINQRAPENAPEKS